MIVATFLIIAIIACAAFSKMLKTYYRLKREHLKEMLGNARGLKGEGK